MTALRLASTLTTCLVVDCCAVEGNGTAVGTDANEMARIARADVNIPDALRKRASREPEAAERRDF
jgi:hypothetical protein